MPIKAGTNSGDFQAFGGRWSRLSGQSPREVQAILVAGAEEIANVLEKYFADSMSGQHVVFHVLSGTLSFIILVHDKPRVAGPPVN